MGVSGVVLYLVLLCFGATISPGVGVAGSMLALVPPAVTDFAHVPAYGVLTWLLASALQEQRWPKHMALRIAVVAAMVFGVCMELAQGFAPGRSADPRDVALNAVGITLALLLVAPTQEHPVYTVARRFLPLLNRH